MASVKQLQIGNNVYDIKATYDINNNSLAIQELTQAEYDALSTTEQNNGTTYYITDGNGGGASGGGSSGTVDAYTKSQTNALLATKANTADLATVATSGSYNDLSNKPTIPAAQVQSDWNATTGIGAILNKPTNVSALTNDAGYLTSIPASSVAVELTQTEYNALSNAEKNNGTTYYITDSNIINSTTASDISYSNTTSGLSAATVQGAIDEIEHAIGSTTYYNHESDIIAWTPNSSVVGNNYSGVNIRNGVVSIMLNLYTSAALTSGTTYIAYTLSDAFIDLVGHTTIYGVGASNGVLVNIEFNTWDGGNFIKLTPRGAISSGQNIRGSLCFLISH